MLMPRRLPTPAHRTTHPDERNVTLHSSSEHNVTLYSCGTGVDVLDGPRSVAEREDDAAAGRVGISVIQCQSSAPYFHHDLTCDLLISCTLSPRQFLS